MNYNNEGYRPPITYSQLNTKSFCKRKQIMCECANVIGRCIYTQCIKRTNDRERHCAKINFERWLDGDTE